MKYCVDICVIGGGVMGLSSAYYLTKAGKSVILLEKHEIGSGASGACDDMILLQSKKPGIVLEMAIESLEVYRGLSDELSSELGFETRGGMVLIDDEKQLKVMEAFVEKQRAFGLDVDIVGKAELRRRQPYVSNDVIASTYCAIDSQADPLCLMRAFLKNAHSHGLDVMRRTSPHAIERLGDHWRVDIEGGFIECDAVVLATGAWSNEAGKLIGIDIPIKPVRGQLAITEEIPQLGETNNWSAAYIASKLDKSVMPDKGPYAKQIGMGFSFGQTKEGNYLIGSTREDAGFDKSTSERSISMLMKQALSYFPVLENVNIIRTIAGFRPGTPDNNPIVGPVDGRSGIYIVAGHEGDGVALAPITGKAIADMICERPYNPHYNQLNLRRFSEAE